MRVVAVALVIIVLFSIEMLLNFNERLDNCYDDLRNEGYKFDELAEFGPPNCRVKKPQKSIHFLIPI